MVVVEDRIGQEKRILEIRKNTKMEKAAKPISDISFEFDRLAGQVKRVQEHVETLDALKLKSSTLNSNDNGDHVQEHGYSDGQGGMLPTLIFLIPTTLFLSLLLVFQLKTSLFLSINPSASLVKE